MKGFLEATDEVFEKLNKPWRSVREHKSSDISGITMKTTKETCPIYLVTGAVVVVGGISTDDRAMTSIKPNSTCRALVRKIL